MKKSVKLICLLLSMIMLAGVLVACGNNTAGGTKSTKLVVYAALNEDEMNAFVSKFKEDTGIEIEYVLGGAGDMSTRVQAEKDSPNADVLVGGSVDVYEPLAKDGLFEKYDSPNNDALDARFNDPNGFWQGWYMGVLGLVINRDRFEAELKPLGLEYPKTWDDLLDERYKNVFVTSNPVTAGGGYIFTACQLFRLGDDAAWDYFAALDKNVHHYYKGAGDCISPVATGEFIVGMSWVHDIYKQVKAGYPIDVVIPEQTAYEIGGVAIVKGGKNKENAEIFVDWLLTQEIGQMNTTNSNRYSVLESVASPEGLPKLEEVNLVDYDRARAGEMKPDVVAKFDADIVSKR
ncbi:ABC transporter substrate-binding protein [Eubacteriales bacterium OttesenSCG-928-K08]|nr:ABC transporter substrate-binding protein [Eubacteriales bacterium OttesenSCG-928-K08]